MIKKSLFFGYLTLITFLSIWPSDGMPDIELFPNADKLIHTGMYAGLTFLVLWAWADKFTGIRLLIPFFFVVSWGLFMEILQLYTPLGRSFDMTDELANSLGFFPGWLFWKLVKNSLKSSVKTIS
jgi:VanZ family protein